MPSAKPRVKVQPDVEQTEAKEAPVPATVAWNVAHWASCRVREARAGPHIDVSGQWRTGLAVVAVWQLTTRACMRVQASQQAGWEEGARTAGGSSTTYHRGVGGGQGAQLAARQHPARAGERASGRGRHDVLAGVGQHRGGKRHGQASQGTAVYAPCCAAVLAHLEHKCGRGGCVGGCSRAGQAREGRAEGSHNRSTIGRGWRRPRGGGGRSGRRMLVQASLGEEKSRAGTH